MRQQDPLHVPFHHRARRPVEIAVPERRLPALLIINKDQLLAQSVLEIAVVALKCIAIEARRRAPASSVMIGNDE
jgi:hypothetical protein